jgi:hypothetical protein
MFWDTQTYRVVFVPVAFLPLFYRERFLKIEIRHPTDFEAPGNIQLKGVRYGDTGLPAASHCFWKKIFRERAAHVSGRFRVISQAFSNKLGLGYARHFDGGGCRDAGSAVPGGDSA